jgi:uroporphyrinogen decarboxylase
MKHVFGEPKMNAIPKNPKPDFNTLLAVLKGETYSDRLFSCELAVDEEIKKAIMEDYLNETYYPPPVSHWGSNRMESSDSRAMRESYAKFYRQSLRFWYLMGYSLYSDLTFINRFENMCTLTVKTVDTATLSKGDRHWAVEGRGMISSWDDYERFPWERPTQFIEEYIDYLDLIEDFIPEGMKLGVVGTLFEEPLEWIFGYENFFYLLYDQPDLVRAVFDQVGKIMEEFYRSVVTHETVGFVFHADDLGYRSGTLISVDHLRLLVFPWFERYAFIAHQHDKPFFLHCCGRKDQIMDILIDEVKVDAIHAFEDTSYPVHRYKKQWGDRVGLIGGVDVDKLTRYDEESLRTYIRDILEVCTEGGRYVFGSGNSIANYVPVKNYLIMMDEAQKWRS